MKICFFFSQTIINRQPAVSFVMKNYFKQDVRNNNICIYARTIKNKNKYFNETTMSVVLADGSLRLVARVSIVRRYSVNVETSTGNLPVRHTFEQ